MTDQFTCKTFQDELPDLVLTPGAVPSPAAAAHLKACVPCADEYIAFQNTFSALDSWKAPEPTAYFDQKLAVRVREEQRAPRMGWFESLLTRMSLNTGRSFRPAMVGALSFALLLGGVGGLGVTGILPHHQPVVPEASATVNDLQILDRNEQAFQQLDELQQDDDTNAAPASDNRDQPLAPTS